MSTASVNLARIFLTTGEAAHGFEYLDEEGRALTTSEGAAMVRFEKRAGGRTVRCRVDVHDLTALTDCIPAKGLRILADGIAARLKAQRR